MATQVATFVIAGAHYGIDMLRVKEALGGQKWTAVPLAEPGIAGLINLRGQVVLTIDLRTRLGIGAPPADLEPMMVIVEVDGEPISLLVDDVGDVIDVESRQMGAPPDTLPASLRDVVCGVYQLERFLLLVLDIDRATCAHNGQLSETQDPTRRTP